MFIHTQLYLLNITPPPQPGVFSQLTMAAEERPWLWVVYILTVGLPIGLTVLFCWPKVTHQHYGLVVFPALSVCLIFNSSCHFHYTAKQHSYILFFAI